MEPTTRAYIVSFTGTDGTTCSVTFDRYNGHAMLTPEQAMSNAISAVGKRNGFDWIASHKLTVLADPHAN